METIDFNLINSPLKILLQDVTKKLHTEPRDRIVDHLPTTVELFLKVADNNYESVLYLVRKDEKYSAPAKIICRSSLEMVFTLCLLLSKPDKYVKLYFQSGWREKYEELLREQESEYNQNSGKEWLDEYERFIESNAELIGITEDERENYKQYFSYFPTPPQMFKKNKYLYGMDDKTKALLKLIYREYYGYLSQILHISDSGLAVHSTPLLTELTSSQRDILKSEPITISMMCLLILLSEINLTFDYNHSPKLKELWTYISEFIPIQKEIYDIKYRETL